MAISAGTIVRGSVATSDRDAIMRKEDKRRKIYQQLPAHATPLTKVLLALPSRPCTQSKIQWGMQRFNARLGPVTDVYTDSGLSSAYSSGGVAGSTLFFKVLAADAKQILVGDQLLIHNTTTAAERMVDVRGVTVGSDTSSYVAATLLEADTSNALAGASLTYRLAGNAQAELSGLPDEVYEEPVWADNLAQIFMAAMSVSGTEMQEEDDVDTTLYERKRVQSHERLMMQIERALIWGRYYQGVGANGKPRLMMRGIKSAIALNESANIMNYTTDEDFNATTWANGGYDWLKKVMLELSRYSTNNKKVFLGDQAYAAITNAIEGQTEIQLTPRFKDKFGLEVTGLIGLNTELELYQHPLFSTDAAYRRSALIVEPQLLTWRPMKGRDIQFISSDKLKKKVENGFDWVDGIKEGWYCQATLEYDNLPAMGWLDGLGLDNPA